MSLTIRFSDFWPGFVPEQSVFYGVIRASIKQEPTLIRSKTEKVDLEICSNFTFSSAREKAFLRLLATSSSAKLVEYVVRSDFGYRPNYPNNARKRIWVTGENLRPPMNTFHLTLSSDITDLTSKNIYFPYWMQRIDWGIMPPGNEISPSPETLVKSRNSNVSRKNICLFSSNKEPIRQKIISSLEPSYEISKYGSAYSNKVKSKLSESRKFSLQICNENDLYPGYVTEKLQEAWAAQNVPIWAGLLPSAHDFNEDAFINVTNLTSEQILEKIDELSIDELRSKIEKPLFRNMPKIDEVMKAISELL